MHAISRDLVSWQKLPKDTFRGSKPYIYDDTFRDPNVFYNADYEEYWMLITTHSQKPCGVIALYTSQDLKHWEDKGVLFENDMGSIGKAKPELSVPVALQLGESYDFTLLIDGTVAVLYINDQMALSTCMYALPEHQWGIFSTDSEVSLTNLQSSKF